MNPVDSDLLSPAPADKDFEGYPNKGEEVTCNPVVVATGNKVKQENDFTTTGESPLSLTRTYNKSLGFSGIFGARWASDFDYKMGYGTCVPGPGVVCNKVLYLDRLYRYGPDGAKYTFTKSGDRFLLDSKPNSSAYVIDDGTNFKLQALIRAKRSAAPTKRA